MIEDDRRYQIKSEKDMESKVGRALRQTSLISILPRSSPDSNLRGKKNKYSVAKFGHHMFISATSSGVPTMYCAVCRALGTQGDSLRPPTDVQVRDISWCDWGHARRTCSSHG